MRRAGRRSITPLLIAWMAAMFAVPVDAEQPDDDLGVLVFSRTAGFRHRSIPVGVEAIRRSGSAAHGFRVDATEVPTAFTDENLSGYDVVVFLSTTGDVLPPEQQAAFERFIQAGHGFVGIHAAADTEYEWPWYGRLVGGYFKSHPRIQEATVAVLDRHHPATAGLPRRWVRTDEWYDYRASPRGQVHVLMTLDERTYEGGSMGADHPIAWCHRFDGGRAFYTGGGHTDESFAEPHFLDHLLGAIRWAAGVAPGAADATIDASFEKIVLDDFVTDPMELAVAGDGRVVFVERGGVVKIWKPDTRATVIAGFLDVFDGLEDGLLGVTLDPEFARNGWIYLYYSPLEGAPRNVLSRFTLEGDRLVEGSEQVVLEVETQRDECCHSGGSLTFDPQGLLYLSTGDNTSPFASDGYSPIDERAGRGPFDAQKSSGDPFDLRGKILRIRPTDDGYEIPPGNLFGPGGSSGRPEIYAMGCRNPFRISVHPTKGWVYWGDVGPDASSPREGRGPAGHDEFNVARAPGHFGWPYLIGDNKPYHDHDFETSTSGEAFDAAGTINASPNARQRSVLPAAQPAWIWYPYDGAAGPFPEMGSGERCAMAGPVYLIEHNGTSERGLPRYYDNSLFIYEWSRDWIMQVPLDEHGEPIDLVPFLGGISFERPMDVELGPDGCLYVIEWGSGFGGGNANSQIVRIEHYPDGDRPPIARAAAAPASGAVPLRVRFSSDGSGSRAGDAAAGAGAARITHAWDFDGDGTIDSREPDPQFVYRDPGRYTCQLTVTVGGGRSAVSNVVISAGNTRPVVSIEWPPDGGVCGFGEWTTYRVRVEDAEDGVVTDRRVFVQPYLGHDTHAHPLEVFMGATGRCRTLRDTGHEQEADLFTVLTTRYTDNGGPGGTGVPPLTTRAEVVLQPRRKQAGHPAAQHGARIEKTDDPEGGGQAVVFTGAGDHVSYRPVNLHGIEAIRLRLGAGIDGGTLELRLDSPGGERIGAVTVAPSGRPALRAGAHPLRVEYFERGGGAGLILRIAGGGLEKQIVPDSMLSHGGDSSTDAKPGLQVAYYALDDPTSLPAFGSHTPYLTGVVPRIEFPSTGGDFAGSGRSDHLGAVFTGWLTVPRTDRYAFYLESDDGSTLHIGDDLVVSNDGLHGMVEQSAAIEWTEAVVAVEDPGGTHELFFVYHPAGSGESVLKLNWFEFEGRGVGEGRDGGPPEDDGH